MKKIKTRKGYYRIVYQDDSVKDILMVLEEFDEQSNLINLTYYQENEVVSKVTNEYDAQGRNIKSKMETVLANSLEEVQSEYDGELLIKKSQTFNGEKGVTIYYSYSKDGELIEEKEIDDQGRVMDLTQIDREKRIVRNKEFAEGGDVFNDIEIHQDEHGNILKEIVHIEDGIKVEGIEDVFTYDDNNNRIKCKMYEFGKLVLEEDYFFNEQNFEIRSLGKDLEDDSEIEIIRTSNERNDLVKEEQFANGTLEHSTQNYYNENGDLIEEQKWALQGEYTGTESLVVKVFEYEYFSD